MIYWLINGIFIGGILGVESTEFVVFEILVPAGAELVLVGIWAVFVFFIEWGVKYGSLILLLVIDALSSCDLVWQHENYSPIIINIIFVSLVIDICFYS